MPEYVDRSLRRGAEEAVATKKGKRVISDDENDSDDVVNSVSCALECLNMHLGIRRVHPISV